MRSINILHIAHSIPLFTTEVDNEDMQPLRTALERALLPGRPPHELRALRTKLSADIARWTLTACCADTQTRTACNIATRATERRIADIDQELAKPSEHIRLHRAHLEGANLEGANLDGANLVGANLNSAHLKRASLVGARLENTSLVGADLNSADLNSADLDGANLSYAILKNANFVGACLDNAKLYGACLDDANFDTASFEQASLSGARLDGTSLCGANLNGANLDGAYFNDASLEDASLVGAHGLPSGFVMRPDTATARADRAARFRSRHPEVPVVEHLDARILREITARRLTLAMESWHGPYAWGVYVSDTCGTTHCRAGSAIHLAGPAGYALERRLGSPNAAGRQIYFASTGRVPNFYTADETALNDIRACASLDPLPEPTSEQ